MTHLNDTCEGFEKFYVDFHVEPVYHSNYCQWKYDQFDNQHEHLQSKNRSYQSIFDYSLPWDQNTLRYCGEIPIILFAGESYFIDF